MPTLRDRAASGKVWSGMSGPWFPPVASPTMIEDQYCSIISCPSSSTLISRVNTFIPALLTTTAYRSAVVCRAIPE